MSRRQPNYRTSHQASSRNNAAEQKQQARVSRWRQRFPRFSLSRWWDERIVENVCGAFRASADAALAVVGATGTHVVAGSYGKRLHVEGLESRVLLAADLYTDDLASDYLITTDQGATGLDAGDTVTWSPSGSAVPNLIFGTDAFVGIQQAMDAATAGDSVNVADGNYSESLSVTKDLTLAAENIGGADVSATGSDGVTIDLGATVTISGFDFSGFASTGIAAEGNLILEDSTVAGGFTGVIVDGSQATLTRSTISGATIHGVEVAAGGDLIANLSEFSGNGTTGVVVSDGSASISSSVLTGNSRGLLVNASGVAEINGSNLTGNTVNAIENAAAASVDASGNWWGTADETLVQGATAGLVDFTPFLESGADDNGAAVGFEGNFEGLFVTSLGEQVGGGRIQEGIDLAAASGAAVVTVGDGTYDEIANINKSLTLQADTKFDRDTLTPSGVLIAPTTGSQQTVLTVAAPNVTIDGVAVQVNQNDSGLTAPIAPVGIAATPATTADFDNLLIQNVDVSSIGSNSVNWSQSPSVLTVQAAGVVLYDNAGGGVPSVTMTGNRIDIASGTSFFQRAVWLAQLNGSITQNTIAGASNDLLLQFTSDGVTDISDNRFEGQHRGGGGGLNISGPNASATSITVSNNTFSPTPGDPSQFTQSVIVNQNTNLVPISFTNNTFDGHVVGVSLGNAANVDISDNTFIPSSVAPAPLQALLGGNDYLHIVVDSDSPSSGASTTLPISATIDGNAFNDSSNPAAIGTAITVVDTLPGSTFAIDGIQIGVTSDNTYNPGIATGIAVAGGVATISDSVTDANVGATVIGGTATVVGSTLADNTTGISVSGTGVLTLGLGNTITGGDTGLLLDGAGVDVTGLDLSDLEITGQSGDYISLANGAFDDLDLDATGTTLGGVDVSTATQAQLAALGDKITDEIDDNTLGQVVLQAGTIFVTPVISATPTDNDYTRIKNAIEAATAGETIVLAENSMGDGSFNWDEPFALASWEAGNDGVADGGADDWTVLLGDGQNNVTVTAANLAIGDANRISIVGPGDVASANLEGVFVAFDNSTNTGWTFENFDILNFDNAIGFYYSGGDDFSDLTVQNMHIRVAADDSADANQNIGIHYGLGTDITIQNNLFELTGGGDGTTFAIQSNTHGSTNYDGLSITGNDIVALNAGDENLYGVWENGHAHESDISVSNNTFSGIAGNTGDQIAFRLTSHSSASSTVEYDNNVVDQADVAFDWLDVYFSTPQDYTGTLPILMDGNTVTNTGTAFDIGGINASAAITGGSITGASGVGVNIADGSSATVSGVTLQNLDTGVLVGGSATLLGNFFDNSNDNLVDIRLASTASSISIDAANTLGGDDYFIENLSALDVDLSSSLPSFDETDNFRIEDKLFHATDSNTSGLIRVQSSQLFVTTPGTGASNESIQNAVDAATAGDTINVEAGAFTENVALDKRVVLQGAGAGATSIAAAVAGSPVITVTGSGVSIADQLAIDGFTLTGGSNGVEINSAAAIDFVTVQNTDITGNAGNGVDIRGIGTVSNVKLDNLEIASNTGSGVFIDDNIGGLDGLLIDNSLITDNGQHGFITGGGVAVKNMTNITIEDTQFVDNVTGDGVNVGEVMFFTYEGNATLRNVDITGDKATYGMQFRGNNAGGAINVEFDDVVVDGTFKKVGFLLQEVTEISGVTFAGVDVREANASWAAMAIDHGDADAIDLGDTKVANTQAGGAALAMWATHPGDAYATNVDFYLSTDLFNPLDKNVLADNFTIEQIVVHEVDQAGLGLVTWNPGQLYVPSTQTIQAAIDAASPDDVVNIAAGTFVENVNLNKNVDLVGAGKGVTIIDGSTAAGYDNALDISASGNSAADRLIVSDLSVTAATGSGIRGSSIDHLAIENVGATNNSDDGIFLSTVTDLVMTNVMAMDNGVPAPANASLGRGIGLNGVNDVVLTDIVATGNYSSGLSIGARAATAGNTSNIAINGGDFSGNGLTRPEGAPGISLFVDDTAGPSSITGVTIDGVLTADGNTQAGITLFNAATNPATVIDDVKIGQVPGSDVSMTNNAGGGVWVIGNTTNVDVTATLDRGTANNGVGAAIYGQDELGTNSPGNISLDGSTFVDWSQLDPAISLATVTGLPVPFPAFTISTNPVSVAGATFDGIDPSALATGDSDFFVIEDQIVHAIDVAGAGLIDFDPAGNHYVTTNSFVAGINTDPSIQRGIGVSTAGDTLFVDAGTYTGNVTITKDIDIVGDAGGGTTVTASTGNVFLLNGAGFGTADDEVTIANVNLDGGAGAANTGVFIDGNADLGLFSLSNADVEGFRLYGFFVDPLATQTYPGDSGPSPSQSALVQQVNLSDLDFTGNGLGGGGGTADIQFFGFNNNANLTNITTFGTRTGNGTADGGRGAIQFRGIGGSDGTDVTSIGTVSFDNVDVSGKYRNQMIGIQRYSNVDDLSFSDVALGGSGSDLVGTFGAALRFDGVGDLASMGLVTETVVDLGNTNFRGLDNYGDTFDIEFAPDNTFAWLRADGTNTVWSGVGASSLTLSESFDVEDRILHFVDKLHPTHGGPNGPYKGFVDIQANQAFVTDQVDIPLGVQGDGSIQRGIDIVNAGGTVNVSAGTFAEGSPIIVDKEVDVVGQGKGVTILNPGFDTGSSGDARAWWLVESTGDLDISQMTFDGAGSLVYQAFRHKGIGSFDNVEFTEIKFNESGPNYQGVAVAAFGGAGAVDVTNSMFSEIGRIGVLYFGAGTTGTFEGNTYVGKGAGDWLDYALDISAGAVVDVIGNDISGNQGVASVDGSTSAGILVSTFLAGGTEANLSVNEIHGNSAGVIVGFDNADASIVTFNGDNIYDNDGDGVFVIGGSVTVSGDTLLTNNGGAGVEINDQATGVVTGNTTSFTGNAVGVEVDGGTAFVEGNDLNGNTIGILVQNDGIADLGQTGAGTNFTGLGVSTGGNDFSGYTTPASPTEGAIVNLNTSGDYSNPGPQGIAGPTFFDVTAFGNLFSGTFTLPGDADTVIYHDTDDSALGFVDYANLLNLTVSLDTLPTIVTNESIDEGGSVTVSGEFTNVSQEHTVTISWGDGSPDTVIPLAPGVFSFSTVSPSVTYTDDPDGAIQTVNNPIMVTVDEVFGSDSADDTTLSVDVDNVIPIVPLADVDGDNEIDEGQVFNLSVGPVVDPGDDTVVAYEIDWGDGTPVEFFAGDPLALASTQSHLYEDGLANPSRTIKVNVLDEDGTWMNAGLLAITVNNVDPTAGNFLAFNTTVDEGSTTNVFFVGPFIDPGVPDTPFRFAYDFNGNGVYGEAGELGDGTYAGSVAASSATVPAQFLADDDDSPRTIKARIIDNDGGFTEYMVNIAIDNVDPVVDAGPDDTAFDGAPVDHVVLFTDPGADADWTVRVDWDGDLSFDETFMVSNQSFNLQDFSSFTYGAGDIGSTFTVTVEVDDNDGGVDSDAFDLTIVENTLQVIDFDLNASGFDVQFNRPIDLSVLNLYNGFGDVFDVDAPDLTLVGDTVGSVSGSLDWDSGTNTLSFIKTGGILEADNYTITLVSGAHAPAVSGSIGFQDLSGNDLDGDSNFIAGGGYVDTFTVAPTPRVVGIQDFARGPGQAIDLTPTTSGSGTTELPVFISDANGVLSVDFDLVFDPSVISITLPNAPDVPLGPSMPSGWSATGNFVAPGVLRVSISGTTPLTGSDLALIDLEASVLGTAGYGDTHVIKFEDLRVNEGNIDSVADQAVHKVVFLGDTNGSMNYTGTDAALTSRVVVFLDSGFEAYDDTDPLIIADVTQDNTLSGLDASLINQEALNFLGDPVVVPEIPPLPAIPLSAAVGGVDPELSIPTGILTDGVEAIVPVSIDVLPVEDGGVIAATFSVAYDTSTLNFDSATVGDLTSTWNINFSEQTPGLVGVSLFTSAPALPVGLGELSQLVFDVIASSASPSLLDIEPIDPNDAGLVWTAVDGSVDLSRLAGDYNLDGTVNIADYTVWRDQLGATVASYSGADGNGDTVVDQADYTVWKQNFGAMLPPPAAAFEVALAKSEELAPLATSFTADSENVGAGSQVTIDNSLASNLLADSLSNQMRRPRDSSESQLVGQGSSQPQLEAIEAALESVDERDDTTASSDAVFDQSSNSVEDGEASLDHVFAQLGAEDWL